MHLASLNPGVRPTGGSWSRSWCGRRPGQVLPQGRWARQAQLHRRQQGRCLRAVEELISEAGPSTSGDGGSGDDAELAVVPAASGGVALQAAGKRIAVLKATKFAAVPVQEGPRPLAEYMTLPASQYSVLDAKKIERLDEETFVCYVGGLKFFSFEVEPVITVQVTVQERGPTVRLLSAKLRGSEVVEQANEKFSATMTNVVRWREAQQQQQQRGSGGSDSGDVGASGGGKEICSETSLQVVLEVPGWFIVPVAAIEKTGCTVMETVLNTAVPRFLKQLAADYALWAQGEDEARHEVALSADEEEVPDDELLL